MDPKVRIVTRADDLGSFHSANVAIMDAYKKGVVRNAAVIVVAPFFDEAVDMFKGEHGICLSVHGTITCEWAHARWRPVLPPEKVPCIVESDGALKRDTGAIHNAGARFDQIIAELQAQVDRARGRGLDIRHIDDHMAFYWLFEESDRFRLHDRIEQWAPAQGLTYTGNANRLGLKNLWDGGAFAGEPVAAMAQRIRSLEPGDYFMVGHPCYNDAETSASQMIGGKAGVSAIERDIDRRLFMDPGIFDAFRDRGAEPIRYDRLSGIEGEKSHLIFN